MTTRRSLRALGLAVLLGVAWTAAAGAQQRPAPPPVAQQTHAPTPAALLIAKEIIDLKGATTTFDPIIPGVVRFHKDLLIQTNPNISRDIEQVAAKILNEIQGRKTELQQMLARNYAMRFSEQELREVLAFYRSPLGKKLVKEEPLALEDAMKSVDDWSHKLADEVSAKLRAELKKRGLNVI